MLDKTYLSVQHIHVHTLWKVVLSVLSQQQLPIVLGKIPALHGVQNKSGAELQDQHSDFPWKSPKGREKL